MEGVVGLEQLLSCASCCPSVTAFAVPYGLFITDAQPMLNVITRCGCCQVFAAWHARRTEARRKAREELDESRRKKGLLNGREIFLQVCVPGGWRGRGGLGQEGGLPWPAVGTWLVADHAI